MQYLALLNGPRQPVSPPNTGPRALLEAYATFGQKYAPFLLGGDALHPEATTVRPSGDPLVVDGPYPEVSEVVGGAYMFGPVTPERAQELAAKIPADAVELKPIVEFG